MLTTPCLFKYISGVLLSEEALSQRTVTGVPLPQLLLERGMVPGITVDKKFVRLPLLVSLVRLKELECNCHKGSVLIREDEKDYILI